uniref:Uncharacterized protein n=1 Tax=Erpetoichthys calabaricus TaxID=27687 RepID=A0A8C4SI21_ERPCA
MSEFILALLTISGLFPTANVLTVGAEQGKSALCRCYRAVLIWSSSWFCLNSGQLAIAQRLVQWTVQNCPLPR